MLHKKAKGKNKCQKRKIPRKWIAETVGCSPVTVNQVLDTKIRSKDTDLGTRIELSEVLLDEKVGAAINEVKNIVHKSKK